MLCFHTHNKLSEREIRETIPFAIASKRIKYLGINLPKEVKDLYTENYKTLMKETEEDPNKQKDILCSWIGRILLKCPYYPKQSTDPMQSLEKFLWHFSQKQNKQS